MKQVNLLKLSNQIGENSGVLELLAQTAEEAPEMYEALTKHGQIATHVMIGMFDEVAKDGPLSDLCISWIVMIIKALPYPDLIEQISAVAAVHYRDGRSLDWLFRTLSEVISDPRISVQHRYKAMQCYFAALYNQFDREYVTRPSRRSELMIDLLSAIDTPEIVLDLLAIKEFEGNPEQEYFLPSPIVGPVIDWLFKQQFRLPPEEIFTLAQRATPSVRKYVLSWLWVNHPELAGTIEPELMPIADITTLPALYAVGREDLADQLEGIPSGIEAGLKILQLVAQGRSSNPAFGLLLSKISRQDLWLNGTVMRQLRMLNIELLINEQNAEKINAVSGLYDSQMAVFIQFITYLYAGFELHDNNELRWDSVMKFFALIYPQYINLQTVEFFHKFNEYLISNREWQYSDSQDLAVMRAEVIPHLESLNMRGSELMLYFPLLPQRFWGGLDLLLRSKAFRDQFREKYIVELIDLLKQAPRQQNMSWAKKLNDFLKNRVTDRDASRISSPNFFAEVAPEERANLVKEYVQVRLAFSGIDESVGVWKDMVDILAQFEPQRFETGDPKHTYNWAYTLNTNHSWWRNAVSLIQEIINGVPEFFTSIADLEKFDTSSELIVAYELLTYHDDVKSLFLKLFHSSKAKVSTIMQYLQQLVMNEEVVSLPNGKQISSLEMFASPYREILLEMAEVFGVVTPTIAKLLCGMAPEERQQLLQAIPQIRHELHANQALNLRKIFPQISISDEDLQSFEAELIVAFVNPGNVTLEEIEIGLEELKPRRSKLVKHVEKAGLPEYNQLKEVNIDMREKVYSLNDQVKETLVQAASALPQIVAMDDTDRASKMRQMFVELTNFDAATTPALSYLPYMLDGLEGKSDKYGLVSLLQTIKAFETAEKSPVSGNELMAKLNRVRKLVNFTGRKVLAGIDLRDKLAGQFMNVLQLDGKVARRHARVLLGELEPILEQLSQLLLGIYKSLQLTQRPDDEKPPVSRVLKLRAVISKSLASFFVKSAVDICTAEDRELFLRPDHFHLNLIDEDTGMVIGNIQLYALPDRDKRYLLVRGINFRDGVYNAQELKGLTDFVLRTCREIFELATGFDELVFTEELEGWDPDSNNPIIQDHLQDTLYPFAEIIELEKEFSIYDHTAIARVYRLTKA